MKIDLISPTTGKKSYFYNTISDKEIVEKINLAQSKFQTWKDMPMDHRERLMYKLSENLKKNRLKYADLITSEMGKNIEDSLLEIDKCALVCDYYAKNSKEILKNEIVKTEAIESYIRLDPLGIIFAIMPWNFPFWQVFRFATPAIMAGNVALLKHSSNVPLCSTAIEDAFLEAGFEKGIFQSLLISHKDSELVIGNKNVKAITLTGSEEAGIGVSTIAAKYLKKCVLELGGSDPFIVFDDADLELASKAAVASRMIVSGQSCIAAKRFIIHKNIINEFSEKVIAELKKVKYAPLSSHKSVSSIDKQIKDSVKLGAKILLGGEPDQNGGSYYKPTVVTNVVPQMPVWEEETFGPVIPLMSFEKDQEALDLANNSKFGLGGSVWTNDKKRIENITKKLEVSSLFVNSIVKSDPRLPFGGIKASGYGRELSGYGMKEFVNIKTVWIN